MATAAVTKILGTDPDWLRIEQKSLVPDPKHWTNLGKKVGEEEAQVSAPAAEVHYDDSLPAAGQLYHRHGEALQLLALAFQPEGQYIFKT
jgi:hypothetical protein